MTKSEHLKILNTSTNELGVVVIFEDRELPIFVTWANRKSMRMSISEFLELLKQPEIVLPEQR